MFTKYSMLSASSMGKLAQKLNSRGIFKPKYAFSAKTDSSRGST